MFDAEHGLFDKLCTYLLSKQR